MISIRHKSVRQVKYSPTMAAIHETSHCNTRTHGLDQMLKQVIITDLAISLKVYRNKRLVVSVPVARSRQFQ